MAILRLPKRFTRRSTSIELPDDYDGCPDLGWISSVGPGAEAVGLQRGMVVFFDMMLGREVTTDRGVLVFVHMDDLIAEVDTKDLEDVDWQAEALKAQGLRGALAT